MSQDDVRALALMIRDFLGTPYVWGGSSLQGTDCSGFVSTVFRDVLGLQLPRSAAQMYNVGEPVQNGPLQFADLLFFRQSANSKITHVGIYIAQKKFVHASPTRGVMISGLDEKFHREHFVGAKRIVGRAPYDQE
jgi:cell wall-associated NlpC family hydrolase